LTLSVGIPIVLDVSSDTYRPSDLIPIGEAARILGVSLDTVRRWERRGKVSAVRTVGQQRRFRRGDIEALIAKAAS
jgi:excisionase family DNA binding protein